MKFKTGEKVTLKISGGGVVSRESHTVGTIEGNRFWLNNGVGNDESGPFDGDTGLDLRESMFGFTLKVVKVKP